MFSNNVKPYLFISFIFTSFVFYKNLYYPKYVKHIRMTNLNKVEENKKVVKQNL